MCVSRAACFGRSLTRCCADGAMQSVFEFGTTKTDVVTGLALSNTAVYLVGRSGGSVMGQPHVGIGYDSVLMKLAKSGARALLLLLLCGCCRCRGDALLFVCFLRCEITH